MEENTSVNSGTAGSTGKVLSTPQAHQWVCRDYGSMANLWARLPVKNWSRWTVRFNGAITLNAIIDSGAADVSVPADIVSTLIRTKTVSEEDFLGVQTYVLADGTEVPSPRFRIRSLKVGNKTLENVTASIASGNADILLGQSFLGRFKSWSVAMLKMLKAFGCGPHRTICGLRLYRRWSVPRA